MPVVDRSEQIRQLPLALAVALRLRDAGAADELIAAALAIEAEGVASVLGLARAKLDRLTDGGPAQEAQNQAGNPASPDQEPDR